MLGKEDDPASLLGFGNFSGVKSLLNFGMVDKISECLLKSRKSSAIFTGSNWSHRRDGPLLKYLNRIA